MTFTINIGWWLIPVIITIISVGEVVIYTTRRKPGGDYDCGADILLVGAAAIIVSLLTWMVYFLF